MDAPTTDIIRMYRPLRPELRDDTDDSTLGVMRGHFAVFDTETVIDSWWEGKFRETIAPGAFRKTMDENRDNIKVLFDHGFDGQIGNKVLGPVRSLTEDDEGAAYEVPLLDTSYNRDLLPGLRAGLYGASFRFQVIKEDWWEPETGSTELPLRTIRELKLFEFGPVTFPAYQAATAGVRSGPDFMLWRSLDDEGRTELVRLLRRTGTPEQGAATPSIDEPGDPHSPSPAVLAQRARRLQNQLSSLRRPR
jgi:HK97 family phage prohead protease